MWYLLQRWNPDFERGWSMYSDTLGDLIQWVHCIHYSHSRSLMRSLRFLRIIWCRHQEIPVQCNSRTWYQYWWSYGSPVNRSISSPGSVGLLYCTIWDKANVHSGSKTLSQHFRVWPSCLMSRLSYSATVIFFDDTLMNVQGWTESNFQGLKRSTLRGSPVIIVLKQG